MFVGLHASGSENVFGCVLGESVGLTGGKSDPPDLSSFRITPGQKQQSVSTEK